MKSILTVIAFSISSYCMSNSITSSYSFGNSTNGSSNDTAIQQSQEIQRLNKEIIRQKQISQNILKAYNTDKAKHKRLIEMHEKLNSLENEKYTRRINTLENDRNSLAITAVIYFVGVLAKAVYGDEHIDIYTNNINKKPKTQNGDLEKSINLSDENLKIIANKYITLSDLKR